MVHRSARCVTCKSRRVKCDFARPTCQRCRKASRICTWDPDEETTRPFRSENAFAQGQPRRPKRDLENVPNSVALIRSLPPSLSIPVELHAFHYWAENFTQCPDNLLDIEQEYNSYALSSWGRAEPGSTLHLAVSAYSLAVFGRTRRMYKILETADKFYTQSIIKMRKEILDLSNERIDQLLIATILMTNYENTMYRVKRQCILSSASATDEASSRFWKDIWHHQGTIGLLYARQQQGHPQNSPLGRAIRRPLIRSYVLRGGTVDEWLRNGALFGEEGPALELDSLMIRVAALRSKSLDWVRSIDQGLINDHDKLKHLEIEARDLDLALESWSLKLPEDFKFSVCFSDKEAELAKVNLQYEGAGHQYTSYGHAAVWNRYRAVRLIVGGVRMRILSAQAQFSPANMTLNAELKDFQEIITSLATDMCRSMSFFFFIPNTMQVEGQETLGIEGTTQTEHGIMPNVATFLTWPLGVAVSTEVVPYSHKQWLRRRLKTVARVLGNDMVRFIAEKNVLKF